VNLPSIRWTWQVFGEPDKYLVNLNSIWWTWLVSLVNLPSIRWTCLVSGEPDKYLVNLTSIFGKPDQYLWWTWLEVLSVWVCECVCVGFYYKKLRFDFSWGTWFFALIISNFKLAFFKWRLSTVHFKFDAKIFIPDSRVIIAFGLSLRNFGWILECEQVCLLGFEDKIFFIKPMSGCMEGANW